ncbi:MAG TPA: ABC-2 transporter permease [Methanocorpusculum sp.]|nr:ABC-2 transporter permease [Methanocorpusculum sp.]HJK06931.1 ABC-2 transporter permease [Methanocorpusculum sp.]HJK14750.1 ABC-2 transporter permease [Methanocorpusculum sp.]HJK16828.1 ABC-2 transporter permease [Methanocorpusculum sp.]HJK27840.1 ABC-2 transporter permease [Methanocorpusculum sp.]
MNGLLLKDWISLRTAIVLVVIVFVFCTVLFVPWGVSSVAFLIGIAMALLLPVNAMILDTASRWERYVLALPLSRREILAARYQFAYLCLGVVALICGIAAVVSVLFLDGYDLLGVSPLIWWTGCMGVALLILDLMLAVYFVYRMNIGILLFVVVCFVPTLAVYVQDLMVPALLSPLALVLLLAGLLGLWISWRVALQAFECWDAA